MYILLTNLIPNNHSKYPKFQIKKRSLEKENEPQPNTLNMTRFVTPIKTVEKDSLKTHDKKIKETTVHKPDESVDEKKTNKKSDNPLLKMFEKMREKNVRFDFITERISFV